MSDVIRVIDFETTGTSPPEEVIEVGHCDVRYDDAHGYLIGLPEAWLHGSKRITAETRCIHHISPAEVDGMPPFVRDEWIEEARADGVAVLAAHHADFESKWMGDALPWICTYKAALRIWPDLPSHSNQFLRYWIEEQGMTTVDRDLARPAHRAGPDAYATAHVLRQLLKHASVADLIAWTKEPAAMPRCPIGKFRGQPWSQVDGGFLEWMTKQPTMEHDLKWNAKREIDRRRDQLRPR